MKQLTLFALLLFSLSGIAQDCTSDPVFEDNIEAIKKPLILPI